mgnify:CR=1 FL=1
MSEVSVSWGNSVIYGPGAFENTGTVEVDGTTFSVPSSLDATQYFSGNTLTNGTWKVTAGANNATLNLNPADAGITTIGSGATVVLGSTGTGTPTFAELAVLRTGIWSDGHGHGCSASVPPYTPFWPPQNDSKAPVGGSFCRKLKPGLRLLW